MPVGEEPVLQAIERVAKLLEHGPGIFIRRNRIPLARNARKRGLEPPYRSVELRIERTRELVDAMQPA